jgi:hypothetical protein
VSLIVAGGYPSCSLRFRPCGAPAQRKTSVYLLVRRRAPPLDDGNEGQFAGTPGD